MVSPQAFRAHYAIVATDLGVEDDDVKTALKTLAQRKVDDALNAYSNGVRDSYINSAPIPTADLIELRLGYMSLFD